MPIARALLSVSDKSGLLDFAKGLDLYIEHEPSLLACSLALAKTPCSPLYKTTVSPDDATSALFSAPS